MLKKEITPTPLAEIELNFSFFFSCQICQIQTGIVMTVLPLELVGRLIFICYYF